MRMRCRAWAWLPVAASVLAAAVAADAQGLLGLEPDASAAALTDREQRAWELAQSHELVEAREVAEAAVEANPQSFVGHFVLGFVQHYGETNLPKALYHHRKALRLFEAQYGGEPGPDAPWRWHARMLRELALTHGDLEHHAERVRFLERHNRLYDPDMLAEKAWPLMKLGRYDEARLAAQEGLATGDPRQVELALNALCAIEFEAGHDGQSYEACKRALEHARRRGSVNAVDLTNFAEAARSVFDLAEAERVLLEATDAGVAWYGNPWIELASLYTRQGRFPEALDALQHVPRYRSERPPHVRNSDRNEGRRALAAFLLVVGRAPEAIRITDRAMVVLDRRAHNSRDPAQDRAIMAVLDRRARRVAAEQELERASGEPLHQRLWAFAKGTWMRLQGWMSGRQAARLLSDDERLVGVFRIGTADSAILPPWLAGELVEITGPGVVREALARARRSDGRAGADAYYDAIEAEAALAAGNEMRALELSSRALGGLGRAEALLRARVHALAAEALRRRGNLARAAGHYDAAFQKDPGVLRRLGLSVPVEVRARGGEVAEAVADAVDDSPRFRGGPHGLVVEIEADASGGRACLLAASGAVLGCGEARPESRDSPARLGARIARALHDEAFAPRVDLSQAEINSLDGSNRTGGDPLDTLFDDPALLPGGDSPTGERDDGNDEAEPR